MEQKQETSKCQMEKAISSTVLTMATAYLTLKRPNCEQLTTSISPRGKAYPRMAQ